MQSVRLQIDGVDCEVSRSGYTGEDGFEIVMGSDDAPSLTNALLEHDGITFCGLGAQILCDSKRDFACTGTT